jgi:hypothetical protein
MIARRSSGIRTLVVRCVVATLWLGTAGLGAGLHAAEKRPLPEFQVATLDGAIVASSQIGPAGQSLLIYVTPTSPASARLLTAMKDWQTDAMAQRVVVVIGAPVAAAQAFVSERATEFASVRWYVDPQGEAWKALRLTGTPYLLGVRDGQIAWALAGVLNDPTALESVVRSWVEPKAPAGGI